jgi:hypothetical protein
MNKIAPLPLLFKGRGGGEGLRKNWDDMYECHQITQKLLFLHSKLTVHFR